MILLLGIITIIYVLLIFFLVFGFGKVKEFSAGYNAPQTTFSIVVPFRNEAKNLPQLFASLEKLNYPQHFYEIIFVNDHSEDESVALCEVFQSKNIGLEVFILKNAAVAGGKKAAIETGISASKKDYILTTDSDCQVPSGWLQEMNDFIQKTAADFIAAPVIFQNEKSALNTFQIIDFLSLQGATIGGFGVEKPFMCNGANLCYRKSAFVEVNGFSGNEKIASGDDVFLLEKMLKHGYDCRFLKSKNAIVESIPQRNFSALVNQRVRWAAKASAYKNSFGKFVGLGVFLMNLALVVAAVSVLFQQFSARTFLFIFLFKFNADFILIYRSAVFFRSEKVLKNYFWCSFLYPIFSSYVALRSLFGGYRWKGRKMRR